MRRAFPEAEILGYEGYISDLGIHPNDRHVLATALVACAGIIITVNLRHFPSAALDPHDVVAQDPDAFLSGLFVREPITLARIIRQQAADLRHPPATVVDILQRIARHAPGFSRSVRAALDLPSS